jgi:hypothetical protein
VLRNISNSYRVNISLRSFTEIALIGFLRVLVSVGRPDAFTSGALKCNTKFPDPAEKIDKSEMLRILWRAVIRRVFPD